MKGNVGGIDKILRIVAGAGLIGATVAGLLPVWGYIGIVPLGHRPDGLVPGLHAARHEHLPDEEVSSSLGLDCR
jgi:hypothetical protein